MKMTETAMDVVMGEIEKLAMCKRGIVNTEINKRYSQLSEEIREHKKGEPKLTLAQRKKKFSKHYDKLVGILVLKSADELCHKKGGGYGGDDRYATKIHTKESRDEYQKAVRETLRHSKWNTWKKEHDRLNKAYSTLNLENQQRNAMIDEDVKEAKMDFIGEVVPLKDYRQVLDRIESTEY